MTASSVFGANFQLNLSDFVQSSVYLFGAWEPVVTDHMMRNLKKGDVFIDIGANIGYFSALAASCVGGSGKVFSIEASPSIFKNLQDTILRNNIDCATTCNVAVTDRPCDVPIFRSNDANLGQTTIVKAMIESANGRFEAYVKGLPLDQIVPVQDIIRARMIKIDVEGAEWLVLQGMKHLLVNLSENVEIFVEASAVSLKSFGVSMAEFLKLLRDAGYVPFVVNGQLNEPYFPLRNARRAITPLHDELSRYEMIDFLFRKAGRVPGDALNSPNVVT